MGPPLWGSPAKSCQAESHPAGTSLARPWKIKCLRAQKLCREIPSQRFSCWNGKVPRKSDLTNGINKVCRMREGEGLGNKTTALFIALRLCPSHGETLTLHQWGTKAGQHLGIPPKLPWKTPRKEGWGRRGRLAGRWRTWISHNGHEMLRAGWCMTPRIWAVMHGWEAASSGKLLLKALSSTEFFAGRNSAFAKQQIKAENKLQKKTNNKKPEEHPLSILPPQMMNPPAAGLCCPAAAGNTAAFTEGARQDRRTSPSVQPPLCPPVWGCSGPGVPLGMGPAEDGHLGPRSKGKQERRVRCAAGLASPVSRKG